MKKKVVKKKPAPPLFETMGLNAVKVGIREAQRLIDNGEFEPALEVLTVLDAQYPYRTDVRLAMVDAAMQLRDFNAIVLALEGLNRISPESKETTDSTLWIAYAMTGYLALALYTYRGIKDVALRNLPPSEREVMADRVHELEEALRENLRDAGMASDDEGLFLAAEMDRLSLRWHQGRVEEALSLAEKLLAQHPRFVPVLNHCAEAYMGLGRMEKAIATAMQALQIAPDDVHALSNLARYHFYAGHLEQAKEFAARLKSSTATAADRLRTLLEPLVYLGDDQGCLEAYLKEFPAPNSKPRAPRSGAKGVLVPKARPEAFAAEEPSLTDSKAIVHHIAAVAACRLGEEDLALALWNRAQTLDPDDACVAANLEDLARPPAEQNGPYAFYGDRWFPPALRTSVSEWLKRLQLLDLDDPNAEQKTAIQDFLREHPELEVILPAMLDRGSPEMRALALELASAAGTPAMNEALRDFGLGRRGTDEARLTALRRAIQGGALPSGYHRVWRDGDWTENTDSGLCRV